MWGWTTKSIQIKKKCSNADQQRKEKPWRNLHLTSWCWFYQHSKTVIIVSSWTWQGPLASIYANAFGKSINATLLLSIMDKIIGQAEVSCRNRVSTLREEKTLNSKPKIMGVYVCNIYIYIYMCVCVVWFGFFVS